MLNVAGSDTGGRIGQATPGATLLIKVASEAAVGKRTHVSIFGTDYPTRRRVTVYVRDYIHVRGPRHRASRRPWITCVAMARARYSTAAMAMATVCARCSIACSACQDASSVIREEPAAGRRPGRAGREGRPDPRPARLDPEAR